MKPVRIAIADDHKMVREGIIHLLGNFKNVQTEIVITAGNGIELLDALQKKKADIVLLDIQMPEMDGREACHILTARFPEIKVIMLTIYNEWSMAEQLLKSGASGYVYKGCGSSELENAIAAVLKDKIFLSDLIKKDRGQEERTSTVKIKLQERCILKLLVQGKTAKQIAGDMGKSVKVIEFHKDNLRKKTNTKNDNALIAYAMRKKLID